jgi:restriction endonuclease Mrr
MFIPDFEMMIRPMLNFAADKQEYSYRDTIETYIHLVQLSQRTVAPSWPPSSSKGPFTNT